MEVQITDLFNMKNRFRCYFASSQYIVNIKRQNQYMNIASYIDHAVLHPTQTDAEMIEQAELAKQLGAASICVKPYAVPLASEMLKGSATKVCTVIGFPQGANAPEVKAFEAQKAIEQGAEEIDMVINIAKAVTGDWGYLSSEIDGVLRVCRQNGALLKVIVETDYLQDEEALVALCGICSDLKVDYIKTSTGFGFRKNAEGQLFCKGAELRHVKLFKEHLRNGVKIKASGGIRNFEQAKAFIDAGAERLGTSALVAIVSGGESEQAY